MRFAALLPAFLAAMLLQVASPASAEYYLGPLDEIPIERLLENLRRRIENEPRIAQAHYLLARVHTLAFASAQPRFFVHSDSGDPEFYDGASRVFIPPAAIEETADSDQRAIRDGHLREAIRLYRRALVLDPAHEPARIGLGWSLYRAGERQAALDILRPAFETAWEKEKDLDSFEMGRSLTVEIGAYLLDLLDPQKDGREIRRVRRRVKALEARPQWITPIVIPLNDAMDIRALTTSPPSVQFDLDGRAAPKRWQWITPDAAWLVHDPAARGAITSGRQLVGAVTFWVFWSNGYEALAALDNDGDGELLGQELHGLALWRDANTNGISEPGEVRPLRDWNIVALACHGETVAPHLMANPRGLRLADGRTRPTYDWSPLGVPLAP